MAPKRVKVRPDGGKRRSWLHVRSQFSKRGSRLRNLQVTKPTRYRYVRCAGRLFTWWKAHGVSLSSLKDVDSHLSEYVEACWAELEPLYLVVNAAAALQWMMPSLKGNLQQSWSLVRTWEKQCTPCRAASAWDLGWEGLATVMLVGFDTFMRTGELLALRRRHVLLKDNQAVLHVET